MLLVDGKYVMLRQGENLLVDFEIPAGVQFMEYTLEATGYYLPYEINKEKPIQKP